MSYNTNNIKGWGCFGLWVWVLVQSFLSYLIYGYVFSMLWNWFVVPFLRLPSLTIIVAIGLGLIVRLFTPIKMPEKTEEKVDWNKLISTSLGQLLSPFGILLIAWIVRSIMLTQ